MSRLSRVHASKNSQVMYATRAKGSVAKATQGGPLGTSGCWTFLGLVKNRLGSPSLGSNGLYDENEESRMGAQHKRSIVPAVE